MAITINTANVSGGGSVTTKKKFNSGAVIALLFGLVAILLLVAAIAVPAVLLHHYYDERLFTMSKKIASYDRANAQRASLLEKREEIRAQDSRKYYLKATTPALASAELQDAVKTILESAVGQGQVPTTQVATPKDDGLVRNVSANFQMQTTMPNVRKIFYAIETAQPYLFTDNIKLSATVGSNHKSNPGQEPMVYMQFDVAGVGLVNAPPAVSAQAQSMSVTTPAAANNSNIAAGSIAKSPPSTTSTPPTAPTAPAATLASVPVAPSGTLQAPLNGKPVLPGSNAPAQTLKPIAGAKP